MGDEEYHLYQDMFSIYTKEQGVKGNNFLKNIADLLNETFKDSIIVDAAGVATTYAGDGGIVVTC